MPPSISPTPTHTHGARSGHLYERSATSERYELLLPKRTTLRWVGPPQGGVPFFISE